MTTKVHPSKINSANLVSLDGLTLAEGDLLYATGAGTLAKLAKGTAGQVLRRNLAGDGYEFATPAVAAEVLPGTFTPGISFNNNAVGVAYSVQQGRYRRVGDLIIAQGMVTLSAKGSSTGTARLTGLPFASLTGETFVGGLYASGLSSITGSVKMTMTTTADPILYQGSSAGDALVTHANVNDTSQFRFTITYIAEPV